MGSTLESTMPPKKKEAAKGGKSKSKSGASAKKKKWSKGKVREKLNNLVVFDQVTYDRMLKEVATFKLVTPSAISERLKINGSLARRAITELLKAGTIKLVDKHSNQYIYTRNTGDEDAE